MTFREIEKLVLDNGWTLKDVKGSHYHYVHLSKAGRITIPCSTEDIATIVVKYILKQA